jgi:hypothetical protein
VLAAATPFIVPALAKKQRLEISQTRMQSLVSRTHVGSVKKAAKRATPSTEVVPVEAIKALDIYTALWTMPREDLYHTEVATCAKKTIETRSNEC